MTKNVDTAKSCVIIFGRFIKDRKEVKMSEAIVKGVSDLKNKVIKAAEASPNALFSSCLHS